MNRPILLLLLLCPSAGAVETAAFLKVQPGARPVAMSEAFTAVADDLNALTTNPSGLSRLRSRQAAFMHAELFESTRYDFVGYAHPLAADSLFSGGTVGLGVQRLTHGGLEGRDAQGRPTGGYEAADTAVSLAYSRALEGALRVGAGVKFIDSRLADSSARTVAVDLGLMRAVSAFGLPLELGAAAANLGPGLRYGGETEDLPLALSVGAGLRLGGVLLLAADLKSRPRGEGLSVCVGTEYAVMGSLALRAGYGARSAGAAADASSLGGLGMGFGLKVQKLSFDYSFTPQGELGSAQRLSVSSRF